MIKFPMMTSQPSSYTYCYICTLFISLMDSLSAGVLMSAF